ELDTATVVAVGRVGMPAASEIRGQRVRLVRQAALVEVGQAGLPAVRVGEPAELMVEAAVLHHHYHHVIDARLLRRRQSALLELQGGRAAAHRIEAGGPRGGGYRFKKGSSGQFHRSPLVAKQRLMYRAARRAGLKKMSNRCHVQLPDEGTAAEE